MSLRLSRTRKTLTTTVRWEILIRTQTLTLILILFSTPIPTLLYRPLYLVANSKSHFRVSQ